MACLVCQAPKKNEDGSEKPVRWQIVTGKARQSLGGLTAQPWTKAPHVALRGLRRQALDYNYLWELLDCRWLLLLQQHDKPVEGGSIPDVFTDVRQELHRQRRNGRATLLTASLCYSHEGDRACCALEHFLHLGYPEDIVVESLHKPIPADALPPTEQVEDGAPAPKKRRAPRTIPEVAIKAAAGAGMCLPDVALVVYTMALAMEDEEVWERRPICPDFDSGEHSDDARVNAMIVDPDGPLPTALFNAYGGLSDDEEAADGGEHEEGDEDDE